MFLNYFLPISLLFKFGSDVLFSVKLVAKMKEAADHKIYKTFIGMGIDFNTQVPLFSSTFPLLCFGFLFLLIVLLPFLLSFFVVG